jgi:manganese/zinc/iron transport system ATP- binding protein
MTIEVDALNVNYGKTPILWDINVQIPKGTFAAVIGPNGAGKSTFLKTALGLVKPLSGKITLDGTVAYVPQRETVDWDFPITAFELVLMGRYNRLGLFGRLRQADREAAKTALEQVGMSEFASRQIGELSGGQQQRLFIARALVQNADIILLDEPFANVDLATEKALVAILKKSGKTILVVHHDLTTVEEYFDWALLLNMRLVAAGPVNQVFHKENLMKTFGKNPLLFDEAAALSVKTTSGIR